MLRRKDNLLLAGILTSVLIQLAPVLFTGRTYFLGDLTYLAHPWRSLSSEMLQRGTFPLWNPYAYFGLPLLSNFQTGIFYPLSILFYFFPFVPALKLYWLLHYTLAGFGGYFWIRSLGTGRFAAWMAALPFYLGGFLITRLEIPNMLGTVAWLPWIFLLSGRSLPLAFVLSGSLLSGFPPIFAGMVLTVLLLKPIGGLAEKTRILKGLLFAAGITAVLTFGGVELIRKSERGQSGLKMEVTTSHSLAPRESWRLLFPKNSPPEVYGGARLFWGNTCHWGVLSLMAALLGLAALPGRKKWIVTAYGIFYLLLIWGDSTAFSSWIWKNLWPLHYIRYPANLHYVALPMIMLLISKGVETCVKRRWLRATLAILSVSELLVSGAKPHPTLPDSYFHERGPMVEFLSRNLGTHRYFPSPRAELNPYGYGHNTQQAYYDFKHRLYGLGGAVFHLRSAGGFGEPLIPKSTDALQDRMRSQTSIGKLYPLLAPGDIRFLLTQDAFPTGPYRYRGEALRRVYEVKKPLWAYTDDFQPIAHRPLRERKTTARLPARQALRGRCVLTHRFVTEQKTLLEGTLEKENTIRFAQTPYPGWRAYRVKPGGKAQILPIQTDEKPFPFIQVSPGPFKIYLVYRPISFCLGLLVTVLTLMGLAFASYRKLW